MKTSSLSSTTNTPMSDLFSALGDANRFQIFKLLSSNQDLCVSEVAQEIGISTAGVSQHMKILEHAGLVEPNRMGQRICYRINQHPLTIELLELIKKGSS
jgi:ArsR family transcriptional regulator